MAEERGYANRSATTQRDAAEAEAQASLCAFLPELTAEEQVASTTQPVNAFSFKLQQERFAESDFAVGALNDPERIENFTTRLEVRQPLVNIDRWYELVLGHGQQFRFQFVVEHRFPDACRD